ncbi:pentapeptide repeat-containing protein [Cohnella caldifontis]|uniref:pentapeptide repeat-containing protein n=1 Tax=Cohnella caldifontis TaxID=3027471 RepID=UPI0023ECB66E|nr:pentapeptide repeat-containing protein [Cohnella sp. YIM B05605]
MTNDVQPPLRTNLSADCERCFGLCCVALPFAASADFAIDKDAGKPCPNLGDDFRCGVHDTLRERGFRGCTVYDCLGAGQKVSQTTFGGRDWRRAPETAKPMFDALPIMRQLHEMLWYLAEAMDREPARPIRDQIRRALEETERLTLLEPDALLALDVSAHRAEIAPLLRRTSELVREEALRQMNPAPKHPKQRGRGLDWIGAKLAGADLRGADLKGACLIAADLRNADLRFADLLGADLRDADLGGADLTGALFLTQPQLQSAKGDARTRLPDTLTLPDHWPTLPG